MSDYLSSELMMEILARLPVTTLLQIRCVCKSWCSLISSDNFVTFRLNRTTHLNNINNTHLLLIRHFTEDNEKQERFSLYLDNESLTQYHLNLESRPITRIRPYFHILGSCNGLVCLVDCVTSDSVCLWNPTIRKLVVLPEIRITFCSLRSYGYGFDSATNDYKVVRIAYVHGGPEVDIYSLKEGCWRLISPAGDIPIIPFDVSNASVNGVIHWLCGDRCPCIVSFNLGSEEFSLIELPRSLVQRLIVPVHRLSIGVFQDSLCVLHNDCVEEGVASIWVMKQYGVVESWTNVFNLDSDGDFVKVLGLRRNGEVLLTKDEELFSVDIDTRNLKSLGISGDDAAFCVNTYTESLVLINKVNGGFGEPAWSSQLQAL
ncbi:F-box/kelch-repeat protein At3g06240-like [Cornus florida]|uniref:F-box/kelch-repeat protein At3g06240-like n=1 Tax=Cornus florida TaxID=4283 RepID=UPI002899F5EB|nr:F-box/kelch-repeat protein At3g06240-like [Cornus florida]